MCPWIDRTMGSNNAAGVILKTYLLIRIFNQNDFVVLLWPL